MLHVCMVVMLISTIVVLRLAPGEEAAARVPVLLVASDAPTYATGATVTFSVALDNPGDVPVTIEFSSDRRFDLAIFSEERELWRWGADRDFADTESEQTFPPGVTLLGRVTWNGREANGALPQPGTYRAVGTLTTLAAPRRGNEVLLRLTEGDNAD